MFRKCHVENTYSWYTKLADILMILAYYIETLLLLSLKH